MLKQTFAALSLALLATAPFAVADHGLVGNVTGILNNGNVAHAAISYVTGLGNTQTWRFDWTVGADAFSCNGFGSLEVGFTGVNCDHSFQTGRGNTARYPSSKTDAAQISLTVDGADAVVAAYVVCPDTGKFPASPSPLTADDCQSTLAGV